MKVSFWLIAHLALYCNEVWAETKDDTLNQFAPEEVIIGPGEGSHNNLRYSDSNDHGSLEEEYAVKIIVAFHKSVYDPSKAETMQSDDLDKYLDSISSNCNDFEDTDWTLSEKMACSIYQPPGSPLNLIQIGIIKPSYALSNLDPLPKEGVSKSELTGIFKKHAFAHLIANSCFRWTEAEAGGDRKIIQYKNSAEFSKKMASNFNLNVDAKAGYGPVTVSAGYKHENTNNVNSVSQKKTAVGMKSYFAQIGILTNDCFDPMRIDKIKDYISDDKKELWKALLKTETFKLDAGNVPQMISEGFYIPNVWSYGVGATLKVTTTFTSNSESIDTKVSDAISASLDVEGGTGSAGASASTKKSLDKTLAKLKIEQNSETETIIRGDVKNSIFGSETWQTQLTAAQKKYRENPWKLKAPYAVKHLIPISELMYSLNPMSQSDELKNGEKFRKVLQQAFGRFVCVTPQPNGLDSRDKQGYIYSGTTGTKYTWFNSLGVKGLTKTCPAGSACDPTHNGVSKPCKKATNCAEETNNKCIVRLRSSNMEEAAFVCDREGNNFKLLSKYSRTDQGGQIYWENYIYNVKVGKYCVSAEIVDEDVGVDNCDDSRGYSDNEKVRYNKYNGEVWKKLQYDVREDSCGFFCNPNKAFCAENSICQICESWVKTIDESYPFGPVPKELPFK